MSPLYKKKDKLICISKDPSLGAPPPATALSPRKWHREWGWRERPRRCYFGWPQGGCDSRAGCWRTRGCCCSRCCCHWWLAEWCSHLCLSDPETSETKRTGKSGNARVLDHPKQKLLQLQRPEGKCCNAKRERKQPWAGWHRRAIACNDEQRQQQTNACCYFPPSPSAFGKIYKITLLQHAFRLWGWLPWLNSDLQDFLSLRPITGGGPTGWRTGRGALSVGGGAPALEFSPKGACLAPMLGLLRRKLKTGAFSTSRGTF